MPEHRVISASAVQRLNTNERPRSVINNGAGRLLANRVVERSADRTETRGNAIRISDHSLVGSGNALCSAFAGAAQTKHRQQPQEA